jgi:hypothetical protein
MTMFKTNYLRMKTSLLTLVLYLSIFSYVNAQDALPSTGSFGESIDKKGAIPVKKLPQKLEDDQALDIKLKGTVTEVCQAKGCWMTIDIGDGETMRVKFKDYGFFVPKDAAGKTAIMHGVAKKEEVSVDELKHLAEDAGQSEAEINAITEPQVELTFVADGVIIK